MFCEKTALPTDYFVPSFIFKRGETRLQSYQHNFFLLSGQIFCCQKIPTDFSCCVFIKNFCKNFQESASASCTKKSAQKIFLFYRKNLSFQNFTVKFLELKIFLIGLNPGLLVTDMLHLVLRRM